MKRSEFEQKLLFNGATATVSMNYFFYETKEFFLTNTFV